MFSVKRYLQSFGNILLKEKQNGGERGWPGTKCTPDPPNSRLIGSRKYFAGQFQGLQIANQ